MISNVIINKKNKKVVLKIVTGSEQEAVELFSKIEEKIEENKTSIDKMKIGLGLNDLKYNDIFSNVMIEYTFDTINQAKDFAIILNESLLNDYSNIVQVVIIFEKTKRQEKRERYKLLLKLPKEHKIVLETDNISSVSTVKFPSINITKELSIAQGQELILESNTLDSSILEVRITKKGTLYNIPQEWINIEENAKDGIYNTSMMKSIENIISATKDTITIAIGDEEITIEKDLNKKDGEKSKFLQNDNDTLIDINSKKIVNKKLVVLK